MYDGDQFFYDVNGERFYCDSEEDEKCLSEARAQCDPLDERL